MNKTFFTLETAAELLPHRAIDGHKGTFGRVLLVCGSRNMLGCCVLAAHGALRSGAGLVKLAFPDCGYESITSQLTETLFLPLPTDSQGFIRKEAISELMKSVAEADAVMVGCGLGVTEDTKELIGELIRNCTCPLIIDADGINCIAENKSILSERRGELLLTPHPGEMSRLTGLDIGYIQANRELIAENFCREYRVNLLLKGRNTVICNSESTKMYVNTTGNNGLSRGGSGDLLSGIIAGLTPALKGELYNSAALGAFVHGLTADILKDEYTEYCMLPSDCAKNLYRAYRRILACK